MLLFFPRLAKLIFLIFNTHNHIILCNTQLVHMHAALQYLQSVHARILCASFLHAWGDVCVCVYAAHPSASRCFIPLCVRPQCVTV